MGIKNFFSDQKARIDQSAADPNPGPFFQEADPGSGSEFAASYPDPFFTRPIQDPDPNS